MTFLAGCGGGGDAPPMPGPSSCVPLAVVRIQLFGDSTQAGYSTLPDGTSAVLEDPAALLQVFFTARYGAGAVIVTNRAVPGTMATELVAGTDHLNGPWPSSVAADIVVVNHGLNDMQAGDLAGYRAALEVLAKAPAVVIFETPNAIRNAPQYDEAPYAQAMRDAAAAHGLALADSYAYTLDKTYLLSDWAHPLPELYDLISWNVVQPVVAAEVAKLRCDASPFH